MLSGLFESIRENEDRWRRMEPAKRGEMMELDATDLHFAAVVDALPDGLLLLDMSCRVVGVNAAIVKMTGHGAETLAGKEIAEVAALLFEPEVAEWFLSRMDLVGKGEVPELEPIVVISKDGRKTPAACSIGIAGDSKRSPSAIVVVLRDISESRQTEQELRNANVLLSKALTDLKRSQLQVIHGERLNAVGQMASGIAHDFNNSLMPILGFSELLIKRPQLLDEKEEALSMLKDIYSGAKDAAETIRRLRDFYRLPEDTGRTPVDFNKTVESVVALTQPRWRGVARSRGITIDIKKKLREIPQVPANESQIREALTNLMLNSIDALPNGGTISVSTGSDGNWVTISVADTGVGMAEDVKRRVFEPFFTTKGAHGTGMGLSVTHGIVRQHGGKIEFRSEPGLGTTFDLLFPLKHGDEEKREHVAKIRTRQSVLRILCVDDEQWSRDVMKRFLTCEGHSVVLAESGAEGLAAFKKDRFDLVILDRAMPDMSGDLVARKVKKVQPDMPVLLVSGFGEIMKNNRESPEGVDAILSKPVSHEELHLAIAKLMDG